MFIGVLNVKNIIGMNATSNQNENKIYQRQAAKVLMFNVKKRKNFVNNRILLTEVIDCAINCARSLGKYKLLHPIVSEIERIVFYLKSHKINDNTIIQYVSVGDEKILGIINEFLTQE